MNIAQLAIPVIALLRVRNHHFQGFFHVVVVVGGSRLFHGRATVLFIFFSLAKLVPEMTRQTIRTVYPSTADLIFQSNTNFFIDFTLFLQKKKKKQRLVYLKYSITVPKQRNDV